MASPSPSPSPENATNYSLSGAMRWLRAFPSKSRGMLTSFANKTKKLAQDDPRRITHSLKVGLALTVVSLFFYLQPLYRSFGANAIWAVMTVVVVMEFSVGATLGKGLNRILATMLGGCLGVGVQQLATLLAKSEQPIVIALFLYIIGTIMTFMRFVPEVKARYDYGMSIFILTFSLVSISGYRDNEILELACKRVLTIIIGCFIAMSICVFIFPAWNGEDFHNLIANNLEKLGNFLEGFGDDAKRKTKRSFADEYESVLTSKSKEETMANFARWEPRHGKFRFRHPWKKYLEVGNLTRQCAYKIEALDFYLRSLNQKPSELGSKIKDSCQSASLESGKALKILSSSIKSTSCLSSTTCRVYIGNAKCSIESLQFLIRSKPYWKSDELMEIVPAAAIATLLTDVVTCIERIMKAVDELATLANFNTVPSSTTTKKPLPLTREGILKPILTSQELRHCCVTNGDGCSSSLTTKESESNSSIKIIVQ